MGTDVTIRRATVDDVPDIQRVARTAWHEAYGDILEEGVIDDLLDDGYAPEFLEEAITSTEMALFVAADEYSVVGFVSCAPPVDSAVGQVSNYVSPDYWGEGIGSALLDRARAYLDAEGADAIRDTVLADNDVGNAFYRKHFETVEETTIEMGSEEYDAYVYTDDL